MYELLPEFWTQKGDEMASKTSTSSRAKAKRWVHDINVWLQCFALYISVMSNKSLQHIPELMAYMVNILQASQEYEGSAWTTYNAAYRRQAAATGHKEWSKVNPSLYTVCFTGKARKANCCDFCLSAAHKTDDCYLTADEDPDLVVRMRAVESAVVAFSGRPKQSAEICCLFNEKRCRFWSSKYRHICQLCLGNHPALDCSSAPRPGGQQVMSGLGPLHTGRQLQYQVPGFPY